MASDECTVDDSAEKSIRGVRSQDRYLPRSSISRIMRKAISVNGKIDQDAKDFVQECVSEFIGFITHEANEKCRREKRKSITGKDVLWALELLGFENYVQPLRLFLERYREDGQQGSSDPGDEMEL